MDDDNYEDEYDNENGFHEYEENIDDYNDEEAGFEHIEGDEIKEMAERNAFERVGMGRPGGALLTYIEGEGGIAKLHRALNKQQLNKHEEFNIILEAVFYELKDYLNVGGDWINRLTELSSNIRNIQYKNPKAFILGYYVLENNKISKKKFDFVSKNILKNIDDVKGEDVIRYARLFM